MERVCGDEVVDEGKGVDDEGGVGAREGCGVCVLVCVCLFV